MLTLPRRRTALTPASSQKSQQIRCVFWVAICPVKHLFCVVGNYRTRVEMGIGGNHQSQTHQTTTNNSDGDLDTKLEKTLYDGGLL